jgi:two-component system, NarL family, sensor histidine kinase DegS
MAVAVVQVDDRHDRAPLEIEIRHELARGLHDTVGQSLPSVLLRLERLRIDGAVDPVIQEELASVQAAIRDSLKQVRLLLYGVREEPPTEAGLVPAIARLLGRCESSCPGVDFYFHAVESWPETISATAADHLYRIVEEAVTNAIRHSNAAHVRVRLELSQSAAEAVLSVSDDGVGLAPATGMRTARYGLVGARERVVLVGGKMWVESSPGRGTTVRASFPLEELR